MDTVYLIKAALDGFLIGWGTCYLVCCARAWLKTAASAPRDALVRDDGAAFAARLRRLRAAHGRACPAAHIARPLHAGLVSSFHADERSQGGMNNPFPARSKMRLW